MSEFPAALTQEVRDLYKPVIGLEIHIQLATLRKIFAWEGFTFGQVANTLLSPITVAHPGALPGINEACILHAIKLGLATDCKIASHTYFARKNYFYPDLPKGYQLSQHHDPICEHGFMSVDRGTNTPLEVRIQRIHLEEDAGKLIHDQYEEQSCIDLNRAGVGLLELVTHPDIHSPEDAAAFVGEIRRLVRYIGVCDGNMEEGSLRCDANVSVMKKTDTQLGTRAEIKNLNSLSAIRQAVSFEIERQITLVDSGGVVVQETRTWDAQRGRTLGLRTKESADDYRYFPEPDLLPVVVSKEMLDKIKSEMPSLPHELLKVYQTKHKIPFNEASVLVESPSLVTYFENLLKETKDARQAANWILGPVKTYLNEQNLDIENFPIGPKKLAGVIGLVKDEKVSYDAARKQIFPQLLDQPDADALEIAKKLNVLMESKGDELAEAMEALIRQFPDEVERYRKGKKGLIGFFVGQLMKQFKGKANPKEVNKLAKEKLDRKN